MDDVVTALRAFYTARRLVGQTVAFGPPDVSYPQAVSGSALRRLMVQQSA